jgi:hypothetical protein
MAKEISPVTFNAVVDIILRVKGMPRERLFEYPHNDYESRAAITSAEQTARAIIKLLG